MTTIPDTVRLLVDARAAGRCERCGRLLDSAWGYSRQHRRPGGLGGSHGAARLVIDSPANLILLCGHATAPGGCHLWAESQRTAAKALGYLLEPADRPETVPWWDTERRLWLPTHDGGKQAVVLPFAAHKAVQAAYEAERWLAA